METRTHRANNAYELPERVKKLERQGCNSDARKIVGDHKDLLMEATERCERYENALLEIRRSTGSHKAFWIAQNVLEGTGHE